MPNDAALNACIVVSLLCWGAWGIFDKLALDHAPTSLVLALLFSSSIPVGIITLIVLNCVQPGWTMVPEVILWTGLGCLSYGSAMACYLLAMNIGEASYVLGATASYPVILQFLSAFMLGEEIVPTRIGGSLLIALGVGAIGFSAKTEHKAIEKKKKFLLVALVIGATLLWGIWGIWDKKAVNAGGPYLSFLWHCVWEVIALVPLGIYAFRKHYQCLTKGAKLWNPIIGSTVCINVGGASYMMALSMATASYVIVITGCYPLIMYLLAVLILKEKFNFTRLAGIIFVTIGGIITHSTEAL